MSQQESIAQFDKTVGEFAECFRSLDDGLLLAKLNNWSPRDIIAHLIGWNYHLVKGCALLQDGVLPFYDVDPGDNWCDINAEIIQRITSTDKEELLAELSASAASLIKCLENVAADNYLHDFGVRYEGEVQTIESTIKEMVEDYVHHTKQIETLSAKQ